MTQQDYSGPLSPEILRLSRRRDRGSQDKVAGLLKQSGLPENELLHAEKEAIPREGQVVIGDRVTTYQFTEHVLEIPHALSAEDCAALIRKARENGSWIQSTQIAPDNASYRNLVRTSTQQKVHPSTFSDELYRRLRDVIYEGARFYWCWNKNCDWRGDSGWWILRYQRGQAYGQHVDSRPGHATDGRVLSAVLYLNDDYKGGRTAFPYPGPELVIEPAVGKLLLFPSGSTHAHESLEVTEGEKLAVSGWLMASRAPGPS